MDSATSTRALPDRASLRQLKSEAAALRETGEAESLSDAQSQIARRYGFDAWAALEAHVEFLEQTRKLKSAIDANDLDAVAALMTRNPELHRAPLGYAKDGPLTWVAECRVPWEPPSPTRLAMAEWMIAHGSDVHQGGDGPLMRAALNAYRIPMMELLVAHGADVNALWHGSFPIVFAPCESMDPQALKWLLDHGANPDCGQHGTALDYLIAGYVRSPERLSGCIDALLDAGGTTRFDNPPFLALLRGRLGEVTATIESDPALVDRRFPELDCGQTGGRSLLLKGGTLLHAAAEFGAPEGMKLLLSRGASVNARADVDQASGVGGQTPIFHAVSQFDDAGLDAASLLIDHGADLSLRVRLPGDYDVPGEIVECTPLGYALRFGGDSDRKTVALLRKHGAPE